MVYKVDHGKTNYSQRNNALRPMESCNVTSMAMALDYMGHTFPDGEYYQPEDNLRFHIENDKDCVTYYNTFVQRNPWAKGIPAVQVHDVLSWGTNHWMRSRVTRFVSAIPIEEMLNEIKAGRPVVISGTFPWKHAPMRIPLGHIVVLVGYNDQTKEVCYDDPYGKTYLWSPTVSGNDTWVSWELFIRDIKECNNPTHKMGHVFL